MCFRTMGLGEDNKNDLRESRINIRNKNEKASMPVSIIHFRDLPGELITSEEN